MAERDAVEGERIEKTLLPHSLAASPGQLGDLQSEHRNHPLRAYAASKHALGECAYALAQSRIVGIWDVNVQLRQPGVIPGIGITPDPRNTSGATSRFVEHLGSTPRQAAEIALAALASDTVPGQHHVPSVVFELRGSLREFPTPKAFTNPRNAGRIVEVAESL